MSVPTWLEQGLVDLQGQVDVASNHVNELASQLAQATEERDRALKALEALQALRPDAASTGAGAEVPQQDPRPDESTGEWQTPPAPKRVKSTDLVTNAVEAIGRPVTRDELFSYMEGKNQIPTTWERPRNAFNTALGRAVERQQLIKRGDQYATPGSSGGTTSSGATNSTGGSDG